MRLAQKGDIVGARIGRAWVFLEDDVVAFLQEQAQQQTLERLEGRSDSADIDQRTQAAIQRQLQAPPTRRAGRVARALPRLPELPANASASQAA